MRKVATGCVRLACTALLVCSIGAWPVEGAPTTPSSFAPPGSTAAHRNAPVDNVTDLRTEPSAAGGAVAVPVQASIDATARWNALATAAALTLAAIAAMIAASPFSLGPRHPRSGLLRTFSRFPREAIVVAVAAGALALTIQIGA